MQIHPESDGHRGDATEDSEEADGVSVRECDPAERRTEGSESRVDVRSSNSSRSSRRLPVTAGATNAIATNRHWKNVNRIATANDPSAVPTFPAAPW